MTDSGPLFRAFVAVAPPRSVAEALGRVRDDPIWPPCRRTPVDRMHVTVAFLGRVADPDALVRALREAAREVVGDTGEGEPCMGDGPGPAARGPEPIRFRGLGAFPSARRAQVCWVGVDSGSCLPALHASVTARVGELVEHRSERPYHPHLTLARFRRPADVRPELRVMRTEAIGSEWRPEELILFESATRADGARHRPVARIPLRVDQPA